jgi:hypothetical protein
MSLRNVERLVGIVRIGWMERVISYSSKFFKISGHVRTHEQEYNDSIKLDGTLTDRRGICLGNCEYFLSELIFIFT